MARRSIRLQEFAKKLEKNLPKSEFWFREIYERHGLKDSDDKYNEPFHKRIPDILNHKYKYVIEIDGDIHLKKKQIRIDAKKNRFYQSKGYKVFRVVAYDKDSLDFNIEELCKFRDSLTPSQLKPILRKAKLL